MNTRQKIALFAALLLIGILSILVFTTLYLNNDPDGFSWGFQLKGISETHLFNYQIEGGWLNQSQIRVHSITEFVNIHKNYSWYSISFREYYPTVYRMVHYADSHPVYEWWFSNGTHIFIYDAWKGNN